MDPGNNVITKFQTFLKNWILQEEQQEIEKETPSES